MEKILTILGIIAIAALLLLEGYNKWLDIEVKQRQMPKQEIVVVQHHVHDTIRTRIINEVVEETIHVGGTTDDKSLDVPTKSNGHLLLMMMVNIFGFIGCFKGTDYCKNKGGTGTITDVYYAMGFFLFFICMIFNLVFFFANIVTYLNNNF